MRIAATNRTRTANMPIAELALYADGLVLLTNRRVVFGSRTYWLHGIKMMDVVRVSPRSRVLRLLLYVPVVIAYLAFLSLEAAGGFPLDWFSGALLYGGLALMLGGAVFIATRLRKFSSTVVYFVRLNKRSMVLVSLDEQYARRLAARINGAAKGVTEAAQAPLPEASQEREPGEYLYYSDGFAWVTSEKIRLGSRIYRVEDISKVTVEQLPASQFQWQLALAVSLLVLGSVLNYLWFTSADFRLGFTNFYPGDYWVLVMILFAVFLVMLIWGIASIDQPTYALQLRSSMGTADALVSMDSYYCKRLMELIRSVTGGRISRVLPELDLDVSRPG